MPSAYRIFILLLALLGSCGKKPLEVRVLSFNLRYITSEDQGPRTWTARRDAAAATIVADHPDFIGVQEAFRSMLDNLHERVPGFTEIGVGREDGKTKGEYAAILYRTDRWEPLESGTFWLSDTPDVPGSATWGNSVTRICTWARFRHRESKREVACFNAHFDHQSQPARERAAAQILERIRALPGNPPAIMTGDLNATPENPAIVRLTTGEGALTDTWAALHPGASPDTAGTYHGFDGKTGGPRIDYILTTKSISIREADILHPAGPDGHPPSDHFPVRATLELP